MKAREAPGGGRVVEVPVGRLSGWFARFAERHGGVLDTAVAPERVLARARDGATAAAAVPYPPLRDGEVTTEGLVVAPLVEHLLRPRRIGLILVRLGGHSVGVVATGPGVEPETGRSEVLASATGSRYVHGRAAAGGTSQRRFARRREGQARRALETAGAEIERVLLPRRDELSAVVLGGDRRALAELRERPALAPLFAVAEARVLDVPEPRRAVLDAAASRLLTTEITVRDPS